MNTIYYWSDGTWCTREQYIIGGYAWKSDDFGRLEVSEEISDADIDVLVDEKIS